MDHKYILSRTFVIALVVVMRGFLICQFFYPANFGYGMRGSVVPDFFVNKPPIHHPLFGRAYIK